MCGIYITNLPLSKSEIELKLKKIQFRGPDFLGVVQKENLSFGHLRLSIIDLDKRSNQPFVYKGLTIVYNGEIYNFKEVRAELITLGYEFKTTSDTEVLIIGYHEWGKEVVQKLNGMFAFAIHDKSKNIIFCSRDRIGVKPFYYYWEKGQFEICSQIQPLSKNKIVNQEAVSIYLQTGYVPSPYSIYENIFKLPPGCNLIIDLENQSKSIEKYWDLKKVKTVSWSYQEAKEKLHNLLKDAVKIRLQSDVPLGSFLSGGVDSALISAIANKLTGGVKTFTIGFEDPKYDESKLAKKFSDIIGTDHKETICNPEDLIALVPKLFEAYGEPFADSSAIPSLLLNKTTKPDVTVVLSGDGGDESFFGYNHFEWSKIFDYFFSIPFFLRKAFSFFIPYQILGKRALAVKNIFKFKTFDNFIESVFIGFSSFLLVRDNTWLKHFDSFKSLSKDKLQKLADLNIKLWLENDSNVKVDRASMAYSVEVRSPFLDYRIIEFARALPISYRIKGRKRKRILKDILNEYIPEAIFEVPKKGFGIPLKTWIRNELRAEFIEHLNDKELKKIENLNIDLIKKYLDKHLSGEEDYSSYLWRIYVLIKWMKLNG